MLSIAVSLVRNCADIVALTVLHHCLLGVDHCVIVDNGSTDGTGDLLKAIAERVKQVTVLYDPSPFEQDKIVSGVVNEFTRRQPTLVIPFDADEFWDAPVAEVAGHFDREGVNVVQCNVINFVQSRSVVQPSRWSWLHARRRAPIVVGDERTLVRERRRSFVEVEFPRKVLFRAAGQTEVDVGAHDVRFSDKKKKSDSRFVCLHLPLRARVEIDKRAYEHEPRRAPFRLDQSDSWQSLYFSEAMEHGDSEKEWMANSFDTRGCLNVYGREQTTFRDFSLVAKLGRAYAYGMYLRVPMQPVDLPAR